MIYSKFSGFLFPKLSFNLYGTVLWQYGDDYNDDDDDDDDDDDS